MITLHLYNVDKISETAKQFADLTSGYRKFAFYGNMGAGKTTFIIALCKELGVADIVNSPTFTIVNEYITVTGRPVYHLDFYRIKNVSELYDIGIEDYFDADGFTFIEWPEKAEDILPDDIIRVYIEVIDKKRREVKIHI